MSDSITAVAEVCCPEQWVVAHPSCCRCGGSQLRWPKLSIPCYSEGGLTIRRLTGRIPDVTLEKVFDELVEEGIYQVALTQMGYEGDYSWECMVSMRTEARGSEFYVGKGKTKLEASCAALLDIYDSWKTGEHYV